MAISKVVYGTKTLVDLTSDTVDAAHLAAGYTAHDAAGNLIVGTLGQQTKKNLLKGTSEAKSSDNYLVASYQTTEPLVVGKMYTISMYVEQLVRTPLTGAEDGREELVVFDGGGWFSVCVLAGDVPGQMRMTFVYKQPNPEHCDPNSIIIYNTPPRGTGITRAATIREVMLVEGSTPADWAPAEGEANYLNR